MFNRNWLIVLLILLGAGLVMLKNREKTPVATQVQENTQAQSEQTPAEQTAAEQAAAPEKDILTQTPAVPESAKNPAELTAAPQEAQKTAVEEHAAAATAEITAQKITPKAIHKAKLENPKAATEEQTAPISAITTPDKPDAQALTTIPAAPKAGTQQPIPAAERGTGEQRTVTVENAITKKMLGYRYFGTHYPTSFKITANGKEIKQEGKEFIKLANNQLTVRYSFEFLNGQRKGAKEITFAVKPKADNLAIGFDWKDEWRILIDKDKAEPISGKQIE